MLKVVVAIALINISSSYAQDSAAISSENDSASIPTQASPNYMGTVGVSPGTDANGYPTVGVDDQTNPQSKDTNAESRQPANTEKTTDELNQEHLSSQLSVLRGEQGDKGSENSQLERLRAEQRSR